jgi:phosphotransferase system, enzyme I, PtsP
MAGKPLEALALIALGYRSLSMAPASVGPIRDLVRKTVLADIEEYILSQIQSNSVSLRTEIKSFAQDHGIIGDGFAE